MVVSSPPRWDRARRRHCRGARSPQEAAEQQRPPCFILVSPSVDLGGTNSGAATERGPAPLLQKLPMRPAASWRERRDAWRAVFGTLACGAAEAGPAFALARRVA